MPNKRARGRKIRGFSLPDAVYLPARRAADTLGDNLSLEVERFLRRYTRNAQRRLAQRDRPLPPSRDTDT